MMDYDEDGDGDGVWVMKVVEGVWVGRFFGGDYIHSQSNSA